MEGKWCACDNAGEDTGLGNRKNKKSTGRSFYFILSCTRLFTPAGQAAGKEAKGKADEQASPHVLYGYTENNTYHHQ
ncbi:hypothetical protein DXN05_24380 [Deminuibacter soli]|uniref:Uncharacterized protein n=1 Tax=Deminuibacter soli TaxID=2291815 RepID=A0A3E1NC90_9BACT|nr:hypothetical protein DXN05_24380 [Deminuibacter soli]